MCGHLVQHKYMGYPPIRANVCVCSIVVNGEKNVILVQQTTDLCPSLPPTYRLVFLPDASYRWTLCVV